MYADDPARAGEKLSQLVLVHVLLGAIGGLACRFLRSVILDDTILTLMLFGLVVSQASLVAIWAGLTRCSSLLKLLGVAAGGSYLLLLLVIGGEISDLFDVVCMVVVSVLFVALVLAALRLVGFTIQHSVSSDDFRDCTRFTIRDLMIVTCFVALFAAIGRLVEMYSSVFERVFDSPGFAVPIGLISVASLWGVLSTKQPLVYGTVSMVVAFCAGYCLGQTVPHGYGYELAVMMCTMIEGSLIVLSLLIVRSAGYRLMRQPQHKLVEAGGK